MATTETGLKLAFKDLELWVFPEKSGTNSMTYTMSGGSSSLDLGGSADVQAFVAALMKSFDTTVATSASGVIEGLKARLQDLPEPFKTVQQAFDTAQFSLESLKVTLSWTETAGVKKYTGSYELGVSVRVDLTAPKPFDAFALKGIFLKYKS